MSTSKDVLMLEHDNFIYIVDVDVHTVDDSFSHEFGIERGHHYEVDRLLILDKQDELGESYPFDKNDEDLIYELTKLAEDELNG